MVETDRRVAWRCLEVALQNVGFGPEPPTRVWGAWVPSPRTICVVFERDDFDGLLGLRRHLDADVPPDVQGRYIAFSELGEPLGSLDDELVPDAHGIHWFGGDHAEWRAYSLPLWH